MVKCAVIHGSLNGFRDAITSFLTEGDLISVAFASVETDDMDADAEAQAEAETDAEADAEAARALVDGVEDAGSEGGALALTLAFIADGAAKVPAAISATGAVVVLDAMPLLLTPTELGTALDGKHMAIASMAARVRAWKSRNHNR